MAVDQQKSANDALEPYLVLSKSVTSPRAAIELVSQAIAAPSTYVFSSLLRTPAIQNVRSDEDFKAHYRLLEIFAWGTYEDYQAAAGWLPVLTRSQTHKLRLLSLLSCATRSSSSGPDLSYTTLQRRLGLTTNDTHGIEQLVTDAIYANLIEATLDPARSIVMISSVAPLRDLAPGSVRAMMEELAAWSERCDSVVRELDDGIALVKEKARGRGVTEAQRETEMRRAEALLDRGAVPAASAVNATENAVGQTVSRPGTAGTGSRSSVVFSMAESDPEDAMDLEMTGAL